MQRLSEESTIKKYRPDAFSKLTKQKENLGDIFVS